MDILNTPGKKLKVYNAGKKNDITSSFLSANSFNEYRIKNYSEID
jgi:hypothetical protein